MGFVLGACSLGVALPAGALDLEQPFGALAQGAARDPAGLYDLPAGVAEAAKVPLITRPGARLRQAWSHPALAPEAVLADLSAQITDQGFAPLVACRDRACGGFDFRRVLDLLPPPQMFADLALFHVLVAERDEELLLLLVSRRADHTVWQISWIAPQDAIEAALPLDPEAEAALSPAPAAEQEAPADIPAGPGVAPGDLAAQLEQAGHLALDDVQFASGAASLGTPLPASLQALAAYLLGDPARRVVIVGHSDSAGAAEANRALSRARAEAVAAALTGALGVPPGQVSAEGVGHLAPRASNRSQDGRARNRRVEVVLLGP